MHQTEKQIRAFFNKEENEHLKVQMTFSPESIQELLAGQHAALFPSYYEGFPFSVQETLAAGIPTIAYDTPGAHDLLPKKWLVEAESFHGVRLFIFHDFCFSEVLDFQNNRLHFLENKTRRRQPRK